MYPAAKHRAKAQSYKKEYAAAASIRRHAHSYIYDSNFQGVCERQILAQYSGGEHRRNFSGRLFFIAGN